MSSKERKERSDQRKGHRPSASCSRTLARRTDHAQLLGSIQMVRAKTAFKPGGIGRQRERAGIGLQINLTARSSNPVWSPNPQPGLPCGASLLYEMRARELRTCAPEKNEGGKG